MIVVIGSPLHVPGDDERSSADGLPVRIGRAAVARGARVELVGSVGEDPAGDATLLALTRDGIGHVATRRDPGRATPAMPPVPLEPDPGIDEVVVRGDDAAAEDDPTGTSLGPFGSAVLDGPDLDLALRYLDGVRVVVVAERLAPGGSAAVAAAAAFLGATVIHLTEPDPSGGGPDRGRPWPDDGAEAIVIEAPATDPDGVFARTVGAFAAAVESGVDPAIALESATTAAGWSPSEG